ncbi:uracil phosphoribosyltransferase-domain-containing protein [Aspergillus varians]
MGSSTSSEPINISPPTSVATPKSSPRVIGLYGIPGCGKSYLMNELKQELRDSEFAFFEGSEVIQSVTPGGLDEFKTLDEQQKTAFRQLAIDTIESECVESGKVGIVTGHFSFWSEGENGPAERVCTENDLRTYTHIVYVNTPVEETAKQRAGNSERNRPNVSIQHLDHWQKTEIKELRALCHENGILFATLYPNLKSKLSSLILDFQCHGEDYNQSVAEQYLDEAISAHYDKLQTVLFFDADKTLAAEDTGVLFWEILAQSKGNDKNALNALFGSVLGYSYTGFRQAMLLYEESTTDAEFDAICDKVAARTSLYAQMFLTLGQVARHQHIRPVIVTCGLRRVWEKVIAKKGLTEVVKIVGGGRLADGHVVTPSVKANLVKRVQHVHAAHTWAFGDSPVDIPMLVAANQAIVVVGEEQGRSKSMDRELLLAMVSNGLQARQALLPNGSSLPRLDTARLPVVDLMATAFINAIFQPRNPPGGLQLYHATESAAAKLLMTPMRDDAIRGTALRHAHSEAGAYLARRYLADLIGVEEFTIRDVHGNDTAGYRLLAEEKTLIVALMRGGAPMAYGVNKVFPGAQFLHAKEPQEIQQQHLEGNVTVILVDSVINNGGTVVKFVQFIRAVHATIRIIVVSGVVQEKAVSGCSPIRALARSGKFDIVALRLSQNKYTGHRNTDTGNRLFNTTHLP